MAGAASQHVATKACTECQKRKTRCIVINNGQPCRYCARAGKTCTVAEPPVRTPLTRKNLEAVEARCRRLARLVHSLDPTINIEEAMSKDDIATDTIQSIGVSTDDYSPTADRADGWREPNFEHVGDSDGMASLPQVNNGRAFLGSSSGSFLYQQATQLAGIQAASTSSITGRRDTREQLSLSRASQIFPLAEQRLTASFRSAYLVDVYFVCYNVPCPILHEPTFRQGLSRRAGMKQDEWFPLQYQLVLAMGYWIIGGDEGLQVSFYQAARAQLSLECFESGSLSLVQALLLIGNYLQKRDRPNTGYNYVGLAGRMAIGLGLHRKPTDTGTYSNMQLEIRRRIFWTLFSLESGFALTTGRPALLEETATDLSFPSNIDDEDPSSVDIRDRPTSCSAMIAQSQLAIIANRLHKDVINGKSTLADLYACKKSVDESFTIWRTQLPRYFFDARVPDWFRGPRAMILWKEQNLRMIFWRACRRSNCGYLNGEEAALRASETAIESIRDVSDFHNIHSTLLNQNIAWYSTYFIFQSALVIILGHLEALRASRPATETSRRNQDMLELARNSLRALSTWTPAAKRCGFVLETLARAVATTVPNASATAGSSNNVQIEHAPGVSFSGQTPGDTATNDFLSQMGIVGNDTMPDQFDTSFDVLFQQMQNFEGDWTQDFSDLGFNDFS
ncbi:hypothetical protein KVT40_000699 [Elsinoe batatas]|uniref:Zn(2)-C6 fungal-type domain-containing protein n=1 Tax=Elsinoe batatas TaxID=2601811 RepID=A0A8K0PMX8_9PEZI|nr:hypothetical protein KVT40_000699 [Elsinoe batatas]